MLDFLLYHTPLFYFIQSLWRDEAFSLLLAQRPLSSFITIITFEPPVYYILLHSWIRIFGAGEMAARSLSLLGFSLAVCVIIVWAKKIFRNHWLSWFSPVFFFANPMLLYYAFEIRSYGWYLFFVVVSLFAYTQRLRLLYVVATTLGLYTHTYMIFVLFVQCLHYLLTYFSDLRKKRPIALVRDPMLQSFALVTLLYVPWLYKIVGDFSRLRESWYFPVDMQLIKSVIGNIFLGYEGTPWYLWHFTRWVSLGIVTASFAALVKRGTRNRNLLFFLLLYVPLSLIIGISLFKPIFVNRYVLFATVAEIFVVLFAIESIRHRALQRLAAAASLLFVVGFNVWFPGKYAKTDFRAVVSEINALAGKNDIVMTDNPLILFETMYYRSDADVYWYNPGAAPFPWFVGDILVSGRQVVRDIPQYPLRAFLIHADGTFDIRYKTPIGNRL